MPKPENPKSTKSPFLLRRANPVARCYPADRTNRRASPPSARSRIMSGAATRRVASLNAHLAPGGSHGGSVRPRRALRTRSRPAPPNPNPVFPNRRRAMASRHRGL
jgi:hypothetical protein